MNSKIIFHIDVNSAFLSWTAAERISNGITPDLRMIPSVVGGNSAARKGIVLAKSVPAKAYGIKTGEPLFQARQKCPDLVVVPPNFQLYQRFSDRMYEICNRFSPVLQRFSIDELSLDYTNMDYHFGPPLEGASLLSSAIKQELGFTVNIGISTNFLLAKMASDLEKPDKIHTLYPQEIPQKMWPLAIENLFMLGRKTAEKLRQKGIFTIGQIASCDPSFLEYHFKSHGRQIWAYANGIDSSSLHPEHIAPVKSFSNGTTTPNDLRSLEEIQSVLLALSEKTSSRLRKAGYRCSLVELSLKSANFRCYSHQIRLGSCIHTTNDVYQTAKFLLRQMWKGEPIRALSLCLGCLSAGPVQLSIFDRTDSLRSEKIDFSVDNIRSKYGYSAVTRAVLLNKIPLDCGSSFQKSYQ